MNKLGGPPPEKPILSFWHASVAKNAAAEFAMQCELERGTNFRDIVLCNLDGDNVMLLQFPTHVLDTYRQNLSNGSFLMSAQFLTQLVSI